MHSMKVRLDSYDSRESLRENFNLKNGSGQAQQFENGLHPCIHRLETRLKRGLLREIKR